MRQAALRPVIKMQGAGPMNDSEHYTDLLYWPERAIDVQGSNSYGHQIVRAFKQLGIEPASSRIRTPAALLRRLARRNRTIAVVNWLEKALIGSKGQFRYLGALAYLARLLWLRMLSARLLYVQHNFYPHKTVESDRARVQRVTGWGMRLFADRVLSHDAGTAALHGHAYLPHPSYPVCGSPASTATKRIVCFGRVMPYKGLEMLIDHWSSDRTLLIAGHVSNKKKDYLAALQSRARGRNVSFHTDPLSDEAAAALVSDCSAAIVAHRSPSMIVSGSIYFALSCGVPVVTVGLRHAQDLAQAGTPGVHFVQSFAALQSVDWDAISREDRRTIQEHAQRHFGTEAVATALRALVDGEHARAPMRTAD